MPVFSRPCRHQHVIAIVDRNKIQSDTWVSKVLDLGDLPARFASHGWHVQSCNGHDLAALQSAVARAKAETARPSVILADFHLDAGTGLDAIRGAGVDDIASVPGMTRRTAAALNTTQPANSVVRGPKASQARYTRPSRSAVITGSLPMVQPAT